MLIEYAISAGEGTLVDYGVQDRFADVDRWCKLFSGGWDGSVGFDADPGQTVIIGPAPDDCTTGE